MKHWRTKQPEIHFYRANTQTHPHPQTMASAPWVPSGETRVEPSTANSDVEWRCASMIMPVTEQASESVALRTETFEIPSSPLPFTSTAVRRVSLQPPAAIPTTTAAPIRTVGLDITCMCVTPAFAVIEIPCANTLRCGDHANQSGMI